MITDTKEHDISATYRQLNGLVRITEAHARILLKPQADKSDAEAAKRIFDEYLKDIKFEVITQGTGVSKTKGEIIEEMEKLLVSLQRQVCYSNGVPYNVWIEEAMKQGINKDKAKSIIIEMYNSGQIMKPDGVNYRSACRN